MIIRVAKRSMKDTGGEETHMERSDGCFVMYLDLGRIIEA